MLKVAVLISGRGSNLQALIDAERQKDWPARIVLVISNVPGAQGLERAEKAGIATQTIDHTKFEGREPFDRALTAALEKAGAELVCLAGFLRLLTDDFINRWRDKLVNIHPSLLPAFKGLYPACQLLEAFLRLLHPPPHLAQLPDSIPVRGPCPLHFRLLRRGDELELLYLVPDVDDVQLVDHLQVSGVGKLLLHGGELRLQLVHVGDDFRDDPALLGVLFVCPVHQLLIGLQPI